MATRTSTSTAAFFGRLFWLFAGPMFLMVLALNIAQRGTGWLTPIDLGYFLILGGMLLGRWLEFRSGSAMTATGEPATASDLRRYMVTAAIAGLALWAAANLLGNHWLGR